MLIATKTHSKPLAMLKKTGKQIWQITLTGTNGGPPNSYDDYGIQDVVDSTTGIIYLWGLGGDIWAISMNNGTVIMANLNNSIAGHPWN